MIIDDIELTAIAHDDHVDFMITRGLDTITVSLTINDYIQLQNMLYDKYSIVAEKIRSQRAA